MFYTYVSRIDKKHYYVSSKPLDEFVYRFIHMTDKKETYLYLETVKRFGATVTTLP